MIRAAKFTDGKGIERLIRNQHAQSIYDGWADISDKALSQVVDGAVAAQGQNGPGASFAHVTVNDGRVTGVLIASLGRAYNICKKLVAADQYFINEGPARDSFALIDAYVAWVKANPKVAQASLTWSDALPGGARIGKLYAHKGFRLTGEIWEMRFDQADAGRAA